ncbi:MAG: Holliday junction resolvase RuvX [Acidimicrobiales bacterium]|nr:Holliday junction resolvase RuvX [Acidimicrobiales bacterium]
MRVLALDLGSKRIGVAVSDADERVAIPITTLERIADKSRLYAQIQQLVEDWEAELVLLGLPIDLEGKTGIAASAVIAEREQLAKRLKVPVELHDERMTTRIAERSLRERGDLDAKARRKVIDAVAASVILQDWMDARRNAGSVGEDLSE